MNTKCFYWGAIFLSIAIGVSACGENLAAKSTENLSPASQDQEVTIMATKLPEPVAFITDPDASNLASEKRVSAGDNFSRNLYERPFTAEDMDYQPDLDILHATIAADEEFYYFTIALKGVNESTQTLTGTYGIEFDRSKTGRGDLLISVQDVRETWSQQEIQIFVDPDKDVGGPNPILADEKFNGNGYESKLEMTDSKLAFASLLPGHPEMIQIAISRTLLEDATEFLWGAWADKGVNEPDAFDYNDRYSTAQAGSPIIDDENYPLAALSSMDNTCRQPFGFSPQTNIPGSCTVIPGAAESEKKRPTFCCPTIEGCSFPESCCPDNDLPVPPPPEGQKEGGEDEPDDAADPKQCYPRQSANLGDCTTDLKTMGECDGTNDIITIYVGGFETTSFGAITPNFTCTLDDGIVCTGPKQEPDTPIIVEYCQMVWPDPVANCKDFPNTFWVENLGICLPLGSSCCKIGEEWLADEGQCVPIVTGDGKADQEVCGDAYTLINGYCVFKGSMDTCCRTVEIPAPDCCSAEVIINIPLDCHLEPASSSVSVTSFQPNDVVDVIGRNINLTWYQVAPAGLANPCWVWVGGVEFVGDLDCVELIASKIPEEEDEETSPSESCAGIDCGRCCIAGTCPAGCCRCP